MHDPGGSADLAAAPVGAASRGQAPTMLLYLSLFLLLLVFFAVLGSFTRLETVRAAAALGSVESAFRGAKTGGAPSPDALPETAGPAAELGALAAGELPLVDIKVERRGDVLRVSLAAAEIFQLRRAELRPDRARLLDALAQFTLARGAEGTREIALGVDAERLEVEPRTLAALRAGALARAFLVRGVPAGQVAAAIEEARAGRVHFSFRFRPEPAP